MRTGGGGLLNSHKRGYAAPPTLLAGELPEPLGEARPTGRRALWREAKERGRAPPGV